MNNKADLFVDESFTYSLSNSNNGQFFYPSILKRTPSIDFYNKWLDGKVFKDYLSVTSDSGFNYSNVYDNQLEETHPPFYYYLIHTICSFFPNTFSKWYGLSLNLVMFILTQLLLFKLSKTVLNSNKYALLTCIFYGFSSASIDNFTYISTNTIITVFYLLSLNFIIKSLDNKISLTRFIELFIIILLGGLSHYLFLFYIVALNLAFIIVSIRDKNYKQVYFVLGATLFGFLWIYLLFPEIRNQFLYSIYVQEIILGADNLVSNIGIFSYFIRKILGIPFPYYFYCGALGFIIISIFIIIGFIKKYFNKSNHNYLLLTIVPAFVVSIFISFCINYRETEINPIKYFFGFFPIVAIFINSILKMLKNKYITVILIIISTLSPIWGTNHILKDTDYRYSSIRNLLTGNNVIVCLPEKINLQAFVPVFSRCNNVFISSFSQQNINEILEKIPQIKGKKYLITDISNKHNIVNYTKKKSGFISNYEVIVYEF